MEITIPKQVHNIQELKDTYLEEIKEDLKEYHESSFFKLGSMKDYTLEEYINTHANIWIRNIEITPEIKQIIKDNFKKIYCYSKNKKTRNLYFWLNFDIWYELYQEKQKTKEKRLAEQKAKEERRKLREQKEKIKRTNQWKFNKYFDDYKYYKNDLLWKYYNDLKPKFLEEIKKVIKYRTEEEYNKIAEESILSKYNRLILDIAENLNWEQIIEIHARLGDTGLFNGIVKSENHTVKVETIIAQGPIQIAHYRTLIKEIKGEEK